MEYSLKEKNMLDLMEKTDFKNLSKNDIINFSSKFAELRPEVAKEILGKFPEFVDFLKLVLTEYKEIIDKIIDSDDSSIKEYYNIANKEMDNTSESRMLFLDFAKKIQADCSKVLDNTTLPPETMLEILNQETELLKIVKEKDSEIRQQEKEIENNANKKDSEKRDFNWRIIGSVSFALIMVTGIGIGVITGKFPKKS